MKMIFFGTPEYAVPFLKGLHEAGLSPVAVVSQPDRPVGRKQTITPTPVKALADKLGIPVLQPESAKDPEFIAAMREHKPDMFVVVAFGQILSNELLSIPPLGAINVHPSLLPRHRGPAPLQETILQGDTESGVTIMQMDEKMDHGPVLAQEHFNVDRNETLGSLQSKTHAIGVPLLIHTIQNLSTITPIEQDHSKATYMRLLTRDSGKMDFSSLTRERADRMIRALNPWPGTWAEWNGKRIKIHAAHPAERIVTHDVSPGDFSDGEGVLYINCEDGPLAIDLIQPEGKKIMSGEEFIRGYLSARSKT